MAKEYGWSGDYTEVADFVKHCHGKLGQPIPTNADLAPIEEFNEEDDLPF